MKFGAHVQNHVTNKCGYRGASDLTFADLYALIKVRNTPVFLSYLVILIKCVHIGYQIKALYARSNMKFKFKFYLNVFISYDHYCA